MNTYVTVNSMLADVIGVHIQFKQIHITKTLSQGSSRAEKCLQKTHTPPTKSLIA